MRVAWIDLFIDHWNDNSPGRKLCKTTLTLHSGRLRLNLNPLNLVRWIDSWPFDKTWKPGWIDSTWVNRFNGRAMNLEWIFIKTPSRARKSFSKASPHFFCTDRTGLRRGQIQCRSNISRDFRRFSRTRFTRWIFCIFNRRRPVYARMALHCFTVHQLCWCRSTKAVSVSTSKTRVKIKLVDHGRGWPRPAVSASGRAAGAAPAAGLDLEPSPKKFNADFSSKRTGSDPPPSPPNEHRSFEKKCR